MPVLIVFIVLLGFLADIFLRAKGEVGGRRWETGVRGIWAVGMETTWECDRARRR